MKYFVIFTDDGEFTCYGIYSSEVKALERCDKILKNGMRWVHGELHKGPDTMWSSPEKIHSWGANDWYTELFIMQLPEDYDCAKNLCCSGGSL